MAATPPNHHQGEHHMTEELKAQLDALSDAEKEAVVDYLTGGTVTTLDDTGGNGPGPKV